MAAPVETKVRASTAAAAVSGLALYALGRYVFKGDVPDVVTSWTYAIVPGLLTFGAGYLARHTSRPGAGPPVITVNATGGMSAEAYRQIAAAVKAYGGGMSGLAGAPAGPEPGPAPPEPPAAAATPPPAAAAGADT